MNVKTYKQVIEPLMRAGISEDDAMALRRISMTLRRWHELECGDGNDRASWSIERDEQTGKPFEVRHIHKTGKMYRTPLADREAGALRRLATIMKRYPGLSYYVQGDPRGAPLYILRPGDVREGTSVDSCYSNGIAVYR